MECVTASTIFIPSLHTVSSLIADASHIHCFLSHLFACLFLSFSFTCLPQYLFGLQIRRVQQGIPHGQTTNLHS